MFIWSSRAATLVSPRGEYKSCKIGFSWTTLFFLWFVPLFRGDLIGIVLYALLLYLTGGLSILIFPFFYNWLYITQLLVRGWQPATIADWQMLKANYFFVRDWEEYASMRSGGAQSQGWSHGSQSGHGGHASQGHSTHTSHGTHNRSSHSSHGEEGDYDESWQGYGSTSWEEERDQAVDVEWHDENEDQDG